MRGVRVQQASLFFLVLLHAATAENAQTPSEYVTALEKRIGLYLTKPDEQTDFSIPAGQCSGYIHKSLLCEKKTWAMRVEVHDVSFVKVVIDDELTSATVTRTRCDQAAELELKINCGYLKDRIEEFDRKMNSTRSRRHIAYTLPPADVH